MAEWLQSHDETLIVEKLLPWDEKRKWLLEMKSSLGEDALEIAEITTKNSLHQFS